MKHKILYSIVLSIVLLGLLAHIAVLHYFVPFNKDSKIDNNDLRFPPCFEGHNGTVEPSLSDSCLPPLLVFDAKFRLAEQFHLATCVIEKSMSTVLAALMCYLNNPQDFLAANRSLVGDVYEHRFCKGKNEFSTIEAFLSSTNTTLEQWHLLAVVRDPLERFLSGFIDKCIHEHNRTSAYRRIVCYNCGADMGCFVHRQLRRAQLFARGNWRRSRGWSYEDIHFFPQNWHCNFHLHFANFQLLRFGESQAERHRLHSQLLDWLCIHGIPAELLEYAGKELARGQTGHATRDSRLREELRKKVAEDVGLKRKLAQMYYFDYALFGLPMDNLQGQNFSNSGWIY